MSSVCQENGIIITPLYQNMLCGIAQYAYDEDAMDFIGINPESLRILGYSSLEEFKGQGGPTMLDITYKEDRERIVGNAANPKKGG